MLGSALYYPNVDIEDANWLRSAILFWDDIQTIVPNRIKTPYKTKDTMICEREGYLRPLRPNLHPAAIKQLGDRVQELISRPEWSKRLDISLSTKTDSSLSAEAHKRVVNRLELAGLYPEKMSTELRESIISLGFARLHKGEPGPDIAHLINPARRLNAPLPRKLSDKEKIANVRYALLEEEQSINADGDWLLVDCSFAELYMAALAIKLAHDIDVAPLTNMRSAMETTIESLVCDIASPTPSDVTGTIINLVIKGLKIDPETPIENLIAFRRKREDQLAELAGAFDDLKSKITKSPDRAELKQEAERVYKTKVRPAMIKLKTELSNQSIQSTWEGFSRSATVSVGAGTALAVVSGLSAPYLLGAGAFLTLLDVAVKTHFARQKVRASSPYTYLLDVERKFSVPK